MEKGVPGSGRCRFSSLARCFLPAASSSFPALVEPSGTGFALELHTDLFVPGNPFIPLRDLIWRDVAAVEYSGRSVLVPSRVHQVLHLCLHFAWSHVMRSGAWRTFRDLTAILEVESVDWEELVRLARESRGASCCFWTLHLARSLAQVPVPQTVLNELRPPLSRSVFRVVERHLVNQLFPSSRSCPSVWLNQKMWEIAILPGRSGHGPSRPWIHEVHSPEQAQAENVGGAEKLWMHVRQLRRWGAYGRVVLGRAPARKLSNG